LNKTGPQSIHILRGVRQQQDEPGRFSICSRQAAVVHMKHMHKVTSEMLEKIRNDAESKIENGDLTPNFTNNDIFKNLDAIYSVAAGKY
ncbi:hypothetical protein H5S92_28215, partial [Escherichia coli]|nr:hypothetical protein [Escherichia coli]